MGGMPCICCGISGPLPARANGFAKNCEELITSTRAEVACGGASTPILSPAGNAVFSLPSIETAMLNCENSPFGRH